MDSQQFNYLGIIGIVGAALMVIGVFMNWITIDAVLGDDIKYSGMDIWSDRGDKYELPNQLKYTFVPLFSLIAGIIALLLMILPTFMNMDKFQNINNILGIVATVLSLIVVVCGLLFYFQTPDDWDDPLRKIDGIKINFGFWLVIVGAIITFIGGAMPILKNKAL
ncbi:MAG: hypothetical protein E7Z64_03015 [Thermoplasmata archaeon]|nr:hypothetical protein [Thermoplasmata archaeon]